MNRIAEQVFFSVFFAIHLTPIEEGEFLLYIMLKKIQIASQFSMLQKQHQMEQEQMEHLHFRTEETYVLQRKTESALTHIQDLLSNHKYQEAAAALDSFSQTFQKERFHPYCQDNLIQAILEGKKLRAEQYHIQVSYEIFLPDKLSIKRFLIHVHGNIIAGQ